MERESLQDLWLDELRDLYSAENQLLKALPKLIEAASSAELKAAFEEHREQTQHHVDRLEQIFDDFDGHPGGRICRGMEGLIEEGQELLDEHAEPSVRDAGLIAIAQKAEHYEIAAYGTLRTWAHLLGYEEAVNLLEQTLIEEEQTDDKLTQIAESMVNLQAAGH